MSDSASGAGPATTGVPAVNRESIEAGVTANPDRERPGFAQQIEVESDRFALGTVVIGGLDVRGGRFELQLNPDSARMFALKINEAAHKACRRL